MMRERETSRSHEFVRESLRAVGAGLLAALMVIPLLVIKAADWLTGLVIKHRGGLD